MENILFISPVPIGSKYSSTTSALASFNQNLVEGIKANNKKIQIKVVDIHKGPLVFFKLWMTIKNLSKYKKILIQYEWNVFGQGIYYLVLFSLFLAGTKLIGKKTFVVLHAICFDFTPIYGRKLISYLYNFFSKVFYYLIVLLSHKIIVTEQSLKDQLEKITSLKRIVFIPHGVDTRFFLKPKKGKKSGLTLGYFGFIQPYKGAHLLLDLYQEAREMGTFTDSKLVFAGGESINQQNDKTYRLFLETFYKKAKKNNIEITGFLDEDKLKEYFSICDLVILPHPVFISSSGVLAMAFSFEKPFILSRPLAGYFDSPDFIEALKQTGLKKESFLFDFNKKSFESRLNWAKKNLDKLSEFSRIMKKKRAWKKISKQYEKLLKQI